MKRWAWILLLLTFLGGCSPRFVYGWLDWIIPWQVDDYVTLSSSQEGALDAIIQRQLRWHRHHELPLYLEHLERLQADVAGPLDEETVLRHMNEASEHWYRLFAHLLPDIVGLIQSFSDKQVEEILAQINQENAELQEKYGELSLSKRVKRANKMMEKSMRKWLGKLSPAQKAVIADYNLNRHNTLALWLAYRQDWIDHFAKALRQRSDREQLERELTLLLVTPDELKGQQYLSQIQENRRRLARGLITIHAEMTPRQSRKLNRELDDLREDLEYLIHRN
ncbi:DUF6279 family lipoprotein [Ferrimonas balearica]|uniref:DUF6279 family lipoprotein n=1 Tax=Ferrimonas balearica TaxID=44012 RepID=UPI001C99FC5F|nr:DUF6279 family lipoprotein [Ferrimonas balearica]MBY5920712.1 hypothetical protein [Ferrimonas balearica]MBY5996603.1 hypothetical protein [Ferrimonas balearica]